MCGVVAGASDEGAGFRPGSRHGLGSGMMLIGECADELTVDEGPGGVAVRMTFTLRRLVKPSTN